MIKQLTDIIWIILYQTFHLGIQFDSKSMTINLRGDLLVISPGLWNEFLREDLVTLGNLCWIFAPNASRLFFNEHSCSGRKKQIILWPVRGMEADGNPPVVLNERYR